MRWPLVAALAAIAVAVVSLTQCERIEHGIYQAGVAAERQRAGLEQRQVDTGEEVLAFLERAGAGPPVVLLHGFASQKDIWLQLAQELPEEMAILIPDLPGHGESSAGLDRDYSVAALAGAVIRLIEQHDSGEPVHLAGSSLGGAVALMVAAQRPDLVLSLVLFNPAGAPDALAPELRQAGAGPDNPLIVADREDFDRMVELVFADPPILPWPAARVLTRMHAERVELHRRVWSDVQQRRRHPEQLLSAISAPVLLVWGEADRILDVASVEFFARHLDHVTVQRLPGVGHTPIIERPQTTAQALRDFVLANQPAIGDDEVPSAVPLTQDD